jgi:meiotically up-regulated gene 157 (Mug157) protein
MTTTTHRGSQRAAASKRAIAPGLLTAPPPWQGGGKLVSGAFADDLTVQFQSIGLRHRDAIRLLDAARRALDKVLTGLDHHALAAAPVAEQVSMLLPRFDIEGLARACRLGKAEVQSALALLVLGFVTQVAHPYH